MVVKFELIGGPFDGQKGLQWSPSIVDPLPMVIRVGYCRVVRRCGQGDCPGPQHIHFWMSNERAPDDVVEYALELRTSWSTRWS